MIKNIEHEATVNFILFIGFVILLMTFMSYASDLALKFLLPNSDPKDKKAYLEAQEQYLRVDPK